MRLYIQLSIIDKQPERIIDKKIVDLNNTTDQMNLIDIYKIFHQTGAKYTFFLGIHGTFSRTDQMLGHKTGLNKFKKTEIRSSILFDHNAMRLEITYNEKKKKEPQTHGN